MNNTINIPTFDYADPLKNWEYDNIGDFYFYRIDAGKVEKLSITAENLSIAPSQPIEFWYDNFNHNDITKLGRASAWNDNDNALRQMPTMNILSTKKASVGINYFPHRYIYIALENIASVGQIKFAVTLK